MKELNNNEIQAVSGGFINLDGLFEGIAILLGVSVVSAFAIGAASVYFFQSSTSRSNQSQ